ncbi:hypothetical protein BJ508DRAFT_320694 [Ascobolus immersus RN42]|uniref:Uncharacterized protein n=1 Tax=Ascobolus immersus RN42 TaxID=1160509 RepID=A0A3N4ISH9_ASCIM|nr:hypothetical protein BJ508DRAFT_320694 [Ascobolus immersus RN42]
MSKHTATKHQLPPIDLERIHSKREKLGDPSGEACASATNKEDGLHSKEEENDGLLEVNADQDPALFSVFSESRTTSTVLTELTSNNSNSSFSHTTIMSSPPTSALNASPSAPFDTSPATSTFTAATPTTSATSPTISAVTAEASTIFPAPPVPLHAVYNPPFDTYETQRQTEDLCKRTYDHSGLNWFYYDSQAEVVGNIDPVAPILGMHVQIACRLRQPKLPPYLAPGTLEVAADWTESYPARGPNQENFYEETVTHTIGWHDYEMGRSDAGLICLFALGHQVYGEIKEVRGNANGMIRFAVRWKATERCSHI